MGGAGECPVSSCFPPAHSPVTDPVSYRLRYSFSPQQVLAIIGEQFEDNDEICGAVVSGKPLTIIGASREVCHPPLVGKLKLPFKQEVADTPMTSFGNVQYERTATLSASGTGVRRTATRPTASATSSARCGRCRTTSMWTIRCTTPRSSPRRRPSGGGASHASETGSCIWCCTREKSAWMNTLTSCLCSCVLCVCGCSVSVWSSRRPPTHQRPQNPSVSGVGASGRIARGRRTTPHREEATGATQD